MKTVKIQQAGISFGTFHIFMGIASRIIAVLHITLIVQA